MYYHWLVPLAAGAADLLICGALIGKARRERPVRLFAVMGLIGLAWNLDIFCLDYFEDPVQAEYWSRIFRNFILLGPPIVFQAASLLFEFRGRAARLVTVGGYLSALLLILANESSLLTNGVARHPWGWYPIPAPMFRWFTAFLVASVSGAGALACWRYFRPLSPRQRVQAKFVFLASVAGAPPLATNLLAVHGWPVYPLGSIGNVLWFGIIAYAITRYRMFDLDYVVRKALSFPLAAAPVIVPSGFAIASLSAMLGADAPAVIAFAAIALALVSALVIPTLQRAIETHVHRAFFPQLYGTRQRLRELAKTLAHILDRDDLVRCVGASLTDILDVDRCEVFMPDERKHALGPAYPLPNDLPTLPEDTTRWLQSLDEPTLASELDDRLPAAALFRERSWEVGIPLRINDRLVGLVGLGQTRDFRIFSAEDLQLLATVAASASVALDNVRLSEQLRRSETVLERANRLSSLGQLAAGIAHEIRNPLVAVKTFLDLMPERLEDKEFLTKFRELSLTELGRVTSLIQDLLSFGKSAKPERRKVDVAETLEGVVRLMETTARKHGVELTSRFEPRLPEIMADADQLKQIALNLLLNAIEVSPPEGHVHLAVHRVREFGEPVRAIAIEVHDEGPGIPKEVQEDIFLPFYTTKESGTGLGLALVHQMVIEHGGEIAVESGEGRGTMFRVTLPVAHEAREVRTLAATETSGPTRTPLDAFADHGEREDRFRLTSR